MLSAIQAVEKGARPVFPIMPFSAFPEFMDYSEKRWKDETNSLIKNRRFYDKAGVFRFYQ
jgi:hypothetical protein